MNNSKIRNPEISIFKLIMTFLTFRTTNLFYRNSFRTINLAAFQVLVVFFVNAVKSVVFKLHFGFTVTVDTPAHTQVGKLLYLIHFLYFTMAGLTLYLACFYVLGMVKINVIG